MLTNQTLQHLNRKKVKGDSWNNKYESWNKSNLCWFISAFYSTQVMDKEKSSPDLRTNWLLAHSLCLSAELSTVCGGFEKTVIWLRTLFSSNTLKTNEANFVGSPKGKNCLYIFWKPTASSCPLGQSLMKPLYLKNKTQLKVFQNVLNNLSRIQNQERVRQKGQETRKSPPCFYCGITASRKVLNQKGKCKAISLIFR